MKRTLLILTMLAGLFFSCTKTPDPVACFTANKTTLVALEAISFSNCSKNSNTFVWDFGDGITSTDHSPSHYYDLAGDYVVKLTAYSDDESVQNVSQMNVKVGRKFLSSVTFVKINDKTNGGLEWDIDKSGADLEVIYGLTNQQVSTYSTSDVAYNMFNTNLPQTRISTKNNIELVAQPWTFVLADKDTLTKPYQIMARWDNIDMGSESVSPIKLTSTQSGNWELWINWEIK